MSLWHCEDCGKTFEEPAAASVDLEILYGVGGEFGDHHSGTIQVCPHCGSEEIWEQVTGLDEEEEEEE